MKRTLVKIRRIFKKARKKEVVPQAPTLNELSQTKEGALSILQDPKHTLKF